MVFNTPRDRIEHSMANEKRIIAKQETQQKKPSKKKGKKFNRHSKHNREKF